MPRAAQAVQHRDEHKHQVQTLAAHEQSLEIVLATAGDRDDLAIQPRCRRQRG